MNKKIKSTICGGLVFPYLFWTLYLDGYLVGTLKTRDCFIYSPLVTMAFLGLFLCVYFIWEGKE